MNVSDVIDLIEKHKGSISTVQGAMNSGIFIRVRIQPDADVWSSMRISAEQALDLLYEYVPTMKMEVTVHAWSDKTIYIWLN